MSFHERENQYLREQARAIKAEADTATTSILTKETISNDPRFQAMLALAQNSELREALLRNWQNSGGNSQDTQSAFKVDITPTYKPEPNKPFGIVNIHVTLPGGDLILEIVFRDKPEEQKMEKSGANYGSDVAISVNAPAGIVIQLYDLGHTYVFDTMDGLLNYFVEKLNSPNTAIWTIINDPDIPSWVG